jgi:hypothetical protein
MIPRAQNLDHVIARLAAERDLPSAGEGWRPAILLDEVLPRVEFQWFVPAAATTAKLGLPQDFLLLRVRAGGECAEEWVPRDGDVARAAHVVTARLIVALENATAYHRSYTGADKPVREWARDDECAVVLIGRLAPLTAEELDRVRAMRRSTP